MPVQHIAQFFSGQAGIFNGLPVLNRDDIGAEAQIIHDAVKAEVQVERAPRGGRGSVPGGRGGRGGAAAAAPVAVAPMQIFIYY